MFEHVITLVVLGIVAFIQNMTFTAVSRSRAAADTSYHRWCSIASNGMWFFCNILIVKTVWTSIDNGEWWFILVAGIVYTLCTAEGSVLMMKRLLKTETGARRVGAKYVAGGTGSGGNTMRR